MVMEHMEFRDKLQANTKWEMGRDMAVMMKRAPAGRGRCLLPPPFIALALLYDGVTAMEVWWL